MIYCRRLISFYLILTCCLLTTGEAKIWTLAELAKYGLENSPFIGESMGYEKVWRVNLAKEKTSFAPKVDLSIQSEYAVNEANFTNSSSKLIGNRINLGANSTILDVGQRQLLVHMVEDEVALATLGKRDRKEQFLLGLAQEYYDLQLQLQLSQINMDKQQLLQGQFRTVEALYRQGQRPRTDYLRFQTEIAKSNLSAVSMKNAITQAELKIKNRIGLIANDGRLHVNELSFENYSQLVVPKNPPPLENTVLVQRYQLLIEKSQKLVQLKEKETGPTFQLFTGANYGNAHTMAEYTNPKDLLKNQWNFQLMAQVQINLYDGGLGKQIVAKERVEQELIFYRYRQERGELQRRIMSLLSQLEEFWQNFQINDQLVQLEQNSFADIKQRYQGGLSSYLDYVNASTAMINAKIGKLYAYVNLQKALCEYYFYEGTIDEKCIQ